MPMNTTAAMDRIILALDAGKIGLANAIARGLRGEDQKNALALIERSSPSAELPAATPRTPPALDAAPAPFRPDTPMNADDDALTVALKASVHGNIHPMDISNFIIENFEALVGDEGTYGEITEVFAPYLTKPFSKFADRGYDEGRVASIGSSLAFLVRHGAMEKPSKSTFRLVQEPVTFEASLPAGRFTVDFEDGTWVTFRSRRASSREEHAGRMLLSYLTGSNNDSDYTTIGFADPMTLWRPNARLEAGLQVLSDAASQKSAGRLYSMRSNNCYRCGKTLTVTSSRELGLGPECAGKV